MQGTAPVTEGFSRWRRRGGAVTLALWILALWVSPAVSMFARSLAPTAACCRTGQHGACSKTHRSGTGPQAVGNPCSSSCCVAGSFLLSELAPYLPAAPAHRITLASQASDRIETFFAPRVVRNPSMFQRPPPAC